MGGSSLRCPGGLAGPVRSQTSRRHGGSCYLPPADNEPGTDTRCLFANWHREERGEKGGGRRKEGEREKKKISVVVILGLGRGIWGSGAGERVAEGLVSRS